MRILVFTVPRLWYISSRLSNPEPGLHSLWSSYLSPPQKVITKMNMFRIGLLTLSLPKLFCKLKVSNISFPKKSCWTVSTYNGQSFNLPLIKFLRKKLRIVFAVFHVYVFLTLEGCFNSKLHFKKLLAHWLTRDDVSAFQRMGIFGKDSRHGKTNYTWEKCKKQLCHPWKLFGL